NPAPTAAGRWILQGVTCGNKTFGPRDLVRGTVSAGQGIGCVFTNRFIPAGRITIRKVAIGATGTARFQIASRPRPDVSAPHAAVRRQSVPVTATGDDTDSVPLGTYDIVETDASAGAPRSDGYWHLAAAVCDGRPVGAAQGRIRIRLTADDPAKAC